MNFGIEQTKEVILPKDATFYMVVESMERTGKGISLVVDNDEKLLGIVTNADIRKAILRGISLEGNVTDVINANPVICSDKLSKGEYYRFMIENNVNCLPIVNEQNKLVGLIRETTLRKERILLCPAVIMAGGLGMRLRPLTKEIPKPMLEVNGKPLLEVIISHLRSLGVVEFYISVNYKAHLIEEYFGDGSAWRVNIHYLRETKRLGTVGSLSLLTAKFNSPYFVVNSDVFTDLDFLSIYQFHTENTADITVAVKKINYRIPFGTVELENQRIVGLSEKPCLTKFVNAGIYVLSKHLHENIPKNCFLDMTDLIADIIRKGGVVNSYLISGTWIDIGKKKDYFHANNTILRQESE